MNRFVCGILTAALVLCGGVSSGQEPAAKAPADAVAQVAQQPPAAAPAKQYPRGRKLPANYQQLKANKRAEALPLPPNTTLTEYDARKDKLISPVENQANCGSCWLFSGKRCLQAAYAKAGYKDFKVFSAQYFLDCVQQDGCDGNDNTTVLKYAKTKGMPLDGDYRAYQASSGRCQSDANLKLLPIDDWNYADGAQGDGITGTQLIKNAVVAQGGVGCAVAANSSWDGYSGGVHHGNSTEIDHDVFIIGFKDDSTLREGGYWLMLNSWGESWGEQGVMRIAYGADSIGTEAVYAFVKPIAPPPGPVAGSGCPLVVFVIGGIGVLVAGVAVIFFKKKPPDVPPHAYEG